MLDGNDKMTDLDLLLDDLTQTIYETLPGGLKIFITPIKLQQLIMKNKGGIEQWLKRNRLRILAVLHEL